MMTEKWKQADAGSLQQISSGMESSAGGIIPPQSAAARKLPAADRLRRRAGIHLQRRR